MIDEDKNIIVKSNHSVQSLGSGFNSIEEIENEIETRFDMNPGEYTYGVFDDIGSIIVENKYPIKKEYTELENELFENIKNNAENNKKIIGYSEHRSISRYSITASVYRQRIRYDDGEVDFSLKLDNNLFNKVPVSTLDKDIESQIRNIFDETVKENGIYLGYYSGYAQRGHREPYVRVYGKLKRDSDKDRELRELYSLNYINGIYWSLENITPIPIYHKKEDNERDVDVIAVTKYVDTEDDSYDNISEDILNKVEKYSSEIENNYNLKITEIGKTAYNKEFMTIYIGVKFVE